MARIPKIECTDCGKRLYHTEEEARAALGNVVVGEWRNRLIRPYALTVYRCKRRKGWHIGHNARSIAFIEEWRKRHV